MRRYIKLTLMLGMLGILFYPGFLFHWQAAQDPYVFGNDAQQFLPAFDKYQPETPIPDDYIKKYYYDALMFPGYKALYRLAAQYWDTRSLARQLPYILFIITTGLLTAVAWRVGGVLTAGSTLVLSLSTAFILQWGYMGGTSRMFAYTFIALAIWALVANRPYFLALCTIIVSFFYPLAAAVCGTSLAFWLLLLPKTYQGIAARWSLPKKLLILAATAAITIAVVLPTMMEGREYGQRVVAEDITAWPEASNQGRYQLYGDAVPYPLLSPVQLGVYFAAGLKGNGNAFLPVLSLREHFPDQAFVILTFISVIFFYAIVRGLIILVREQPETARLLLPFASALLLHIVAYTLAPYMYIPGRYLVYTLPLWATFLFPIGLYGLSLANSPRHAHTIIWVPILIVFLLWGGRGDDSIPWSVIVEPKDRPLYEKISELPRDILIAGWPGGYGDHQSVMNIIPQLSRRNVLLNLKYHQVLHRDYMGEMRRRMDAVMSAYFATDATPLVHLREHYGVTHFLVDTSHYADNPPTYFAPWDAQIEAARAAAGNHAFIADPALHEQAGVLRHGRYVLLDMAKIVGKRE